MIKRLLLSLVAGLLLAGTATTLAYAEDGFRFWGYYQWTASSSQWAFAQKGPDGVVPADGSVEGWRYAVAGQQPRPPRARGDFDAICRDVPAETGKKRVAIVVDQGTPEDAPAGAQPAEPYGTCVVTQPQSNGAQVLAAIGPTRVEKGLTCGINGYPATGCGGAVKDIKLPDGGDPSKVLVIKDAVGSSAAPPPVSGHYQGSTKVKEDTNWTPYVAVVVILGGLIAGGVVLVRRRRT
ncbi:SCO2322 family protein [Kribbella sp. NPDC058245]|uniref:SCO2322 family protein n=1 Tax=Kribbella sp. NPDC058245 TaxID=3346399 RepID=UPI0036E56BE3